MRLLKRLPNDDIELVSFDDDAPPPYAILSHTWGQEEVKYNELVSGTGKDKIGYAKIRFCVDTAAKDGLHYSWLDTCCIDKSTNHELSTAINSMFRWYQRAKKCYVYLSDVHVPEEVADVQAFRVTWLEAFRQSKWFTRGWTLQELIAPPTVEFFSEEGKQLGSRISLEQEIHEITNIPIRVLRGQSLSEISIKERMSWTTNRKTTFKEDKVYSLLGIFGVFLPLIYGEGEVNATLRLEEEIQKRQEGRTARKLQDLTGSAVTKDALNHQGSGNTLLLIPNANGALGSSSTSAWSLASVSSGCRKNRYYEVPSSRKIARFVGQSSILSEIDDKFESLFSDNDPVPCITTLVGMGGIGKTQLALKYSELAYSRKRNTFHDVFWFNASSEETLTTDFMKVSTLLAPPDKPFDDATERVEFVLSTLNSWPTRLLLVFDNFDNPSFMNVLDYLPSVGACGVLFTSRLREAGDEFGNMIEVPLMSHDDACQVLLLRLRLKEVPEDQSMDCQRVIDSLGNLPLALEQAGAYMASGGGRMSFGEFMQDFEIRRKLIMDTTPRFWKYTNISDPKVKSASLSILTTWDLSLDRLGSSPVDRTNKIHFFTVLCFLDPNRISRLFFQSYAKLSDEFAIGTRSNDWMSIFKSSTLSSFDENKYRDVIVEMANLSLIRQFAVESLSNNFVVTVHPLIRDWAQFRRSEAEQTMFAREASSIVACLLLDYRKPVIMLSFESMVPAHHSLDDWQYASFLRDMMTEVLAHMDACVNHWKALHISSPWPSTDPSEASTIELFFAYAYLALRQVDKGYEMLERAHSVFATNLGDDHERSLNISIDMCSLRVLQGRGSEVQGRLEYLVEHREAFKTGDILFGNHHMVQFWLAQLYKAQGDNRRATKLAKSLLTSFLLMDLNDNLEMKLSVATVFANLLRSLDLQEDAQTLHRNLIMRYKRKTNFSARESSVGSKKLLSRLETSLVGHLLFLHERDKRMGILEEAEKLLQGIDDYMGDLATPVEKFNLKVFRGLIFAARGLWAEAIEQIELAYKFSVEALGVVDSVTVERMNMLIKQLLHSPEKDTNRVLEIITKALCTATEQLGKGHEKVLALQQQSAGLLFNEQHRRLALPFYDDLVLNLAKKLPLEDPKMVKARSELAYCLYMLPDRSEAEAQRATILYRDLMKLEHLEPKSEATVKSQVQRRERLGMLLRKVKQYDEARKLYEEALTKQMSLTRKGGSDAWLIQQSIAACYRFQREFSNALKVLKEIEKAQVEVLGSGHMDIASTIHQMGLCYVEMDFEKEPAAYENGKACYTRLLKMYFTESDGKLSAKTAAIDRLLGDLHRKQGLHMEAAGSYERAYQVSQREGGEEYFVDLIYLGEELRLAKAWHKQKAVLYERLAWTRKFRGPDSEATMLAVAVLATNAECMKDIETSLRYRKDELGLRRKIFESSPDKTIGCMISIADLSYQLQDFEAARSTIAEILRIQSTFANYNRKDDMRFLADMATIELDLKKFEASMAYSQRIIEFCGSDDSELAPIRMRAEVQMGLALFGLERFDDAEIHATRGVEMREKLLGAEHILTMKSRFWLAKIVFKQRNYERAAQLYERCIPSLQNAENASEYWQNFWGQQISDANADLEVCRLRLNDWVTVEGPID